MRHICNTFPTNALQRVHISLASRRAGSASPRQHHTCPGTLRHHFLTASVLDSLIAAPSPLSPPLILMKAYWVLPFIGLPPRYHYFLFYCCYRSVIVGISGRAEIALLLFFYSDTSFSISCSKSYSQKDVEY